jgi:hypothetical protein
VRLNRTQPQLGRLKKVLVEVDERARSELHRPVNCPLVVRCLLS